MIPTVPLFPPVLSSGAIAADVAGTTASPEECLTRAVPFAGTFTSPPGDRSYFQYGLELSEQGFDAPALSAFERVAKVDPSAITFYNLGTLYNSQGKYKEANPLYRRALEIREKALGLEHPDTAVSLNNLGTLYANRGRLL